MGAEGESNESYANYWRGYSRFDSYHIGVDESLGLIHSLTTTPANVHDITQADQLLHGNEERVWGGPIAQAALEKFGDI